MIRTPTVLILGAGASAPYGYPLGDVLVQRIVEISGRGGLLYQDLGWSEDLERFQTRLHGSEVASIDDFLASNPKFAELGKIGIVAALTLLGPHQDHVVDRSHNWYQYIWRRLYEGAPTAKSFRENRLRIITYNYERSFERYLTRVLANVYPELVDTDNSRAEKLVSDTVPVLHLHGTLGDFERVAVESQDRTHLRSGLRYKETARGIRIVHEDEAGQDYAVAHSWLRDAEAVHLLGFGFHETNVRRLALATQVSVRGARWPEFGGTCLGMKSAEITRAIASLDVGSAYIYPMDSLEYLRTHALLR
ncbi:MAG: hypothetical protein HYX65_04535 [Gemmatimonadetes bacterium]|nr:hypothetical protein [Gemmatimonadota bacterium]